MFFKWDDSSNASSDFACLSYINGLIKPLTSPRKTVSKLSPNPINQEFPSPKFRQPNHLQTNAVYKIPCKGSSWNSNYIGEAGRCLQTRKKKHIRNIKNCHKGSNISNHSWSNNRLIDFDNAIVIDKGGYRIRKTLESWHTAMTNEAENNIKPLPRQHRSFKRKIVNYFYFHYF